MKVVCLVILGIWATTVVGRKGNLVQLNMMFRHGSRTPLKDTYPTDPYIDYNYPPYGLGQLTKAGKRLAYQLGTQIRDRYSSFLGKHYNNEKFNLYSDESNRVQETALIAMAAVWRPSIAERFEKDLNWQPVGYHFREYYPMDDQSENYKFKNISKDPIFIKERLEPYMENITFILKESGGDDLDDIEYVWSSLAPQVELKLATPDWTKKIFPDPLSVINYNLFAKAAFTKDLRKNGACKDLLEWINHIEDLIDGNAVAKSHLYAAHDENIVVMLECLNLRQYQSPNFCANLALEVYEDNGEFLVRIVYQQTLTQRTKTLTVPGCSSEYCPYEQFRDLIYEYNDLI